MPFSRSRSLESMARSSTCWWSPNEPVCHSMASTSVVLPWSTWATIAMLRRSSRVRVGMRARSERGWEGPYSTGRRSGPLPRHPAGRSLQVPPSRWVNGDLPFCLPDSAARSGPAPPGRRRGATRRPATPPGRAPAARRGPPAAPARRPTIRTSHTRIRCAGGSGQPSPSGAVTSAPSCTRDPQLLGQLAVQRRLRLLAGLDLAAGQLPAARQRWRARCGGPRAASAAPRGRRRRRRPPPSRGAGLRCRDGRSSARACHTGFSRAMSASDGRHRSGPAPVRRGTQRAGCPAGRTTTR